jgi:hypothetical protein
MKMNGVGTTIVEERTNPLRQEVSHQRLGADPTIIISVEGWKDMLWLKSIIAKRKGGQHITVRPERKEGKREVMERVLAGRSNYGIVDMDHDFDGSEIESKNICDTRNSCCTFGIIFDNLNDDEFKIILNDSVKTPDKKAFKGWISDSPNRALKAPKIARIATKLRLFCGWAKIPGLSWEKSRSSVPLRNQWYDGIWNGDFNEDMSLRVIIEKVRGRRAFEKWAEFEERYAEELQFCGISDHELEFAIKGWLKRKDFDFDKSGFDNSLKKFGVKKDFAPSELISRLESWNVLVE